jgi:prepilin-type N-terminal cleavage/methylation domain-containing protein
VADRAAHVLLVQQTEMSRCENGNVADRLCRCATHRVHDDGFTLIELTVAILILTVGSLAAVVMQRTAVARSNGTSAQLAAVELARDLVEQARILKYADPALAATGGFVSPPSTLSPANPLDPQGRASGTGRIFTRTWKIQDDLPTPQMKTISVRVAWSQLGNSQSVVLSTLKMNGG